MNSKKWYDYLWIAELLYFTLGFFNILFAWLGMIFTTYLVGVGSRKLSEIVTLLWTFKLPWSFANHTAITPWIAQFAFGFYGVMMTSSVLGLLTMVFFKPRGFCVYCPMGTMTQGICKIKQKGKKHE